MLLRRSPRWAPRRTPAARLACLRHAASVRPEPGSNSPSENASPACAGSFSESTWARKAFLPARFSRFNRRLPPLQQAHTPTRLSAKRRRVELYHIPGAFVKGIALPHAGSGISRYRFRPKVPCSEAGYILPCTRQRCQGFKPDSGQIPPEFLPIRGASAQKGRRPYAPGCRTTPRNSTTPVG